MTPKQQTQYEHNMRSEHGIAGPPTPDLTHRGWWNYPCVCGYNARNYGGRTNHIWGWREKQDAARRLNDHA